jgi:hypothetical protein
VPQFLFYVLVLKDPHVNDIMPLSFPENRLARSPFLLESQLVIQVNRLFVKRKDAQ